MTTQYTPILKLALPVTGELSGTWGDVVNDNITSMVEQAVAGLATINTWTTNSHVLTTANGTSSEARCAMLVAQNGAGLSASGEIICPAATKLYVLKNDTSYQITLKTSTGTGIAVASGTSSLLFCDGTNVVSGVTAFASSTISGNLTVNGNTTLGDASADTVTVNGTSTFTAKPTVQLTSAATNTVTQAMRLDSQSSGTPAAGIGVGLEFAAETAAGNTEVGATIEAVTTDVTATSEDFDLVVKLMIAGAAAAEVARFKSTGLSLATGDTYQINGTDVLSATALGAGILGATQTWTAAQTFRAANAIRSEAASTQDAVVLAGRAGGTSSYAVTLTPTTLTASRTLTLPDVTDTLTVLGTAQTFTAAQTFRAASAVRSEAAATQDAVVLAGRAGGTSSYAVTLTPTTLTANRTFTLPDGNVTIPSGTIAVTDAAQTFTAAQTFRAADAVRSEAAATQDAVVLAGRAGGTNSYAVTLTPSTLSANRTLTLPNVTDTLVVPSVAYTFTAMQTFRNALGIRVEYSSSAQDSIQLLGRNGGTSSFAVNLIPTTLTATRQLTLPDASGTVAILDTAQTFTAAQTFRAANSIRAEAAATQDAVVLAGRAGGTSSYAVTLTPTTLTANRTFTLPDGNVTIPSGTLAVLGTAQTFTAAQTFRAANSVRAEAAATQDAIVLAGRAGGTGSFAATITTATLAASVTHTLPAITGTLATLANTSQTFAGATTFSNATTTFSATTPVVAVPTNGLTIQRTTASQSTVYPLSVTNSPTGTWTADAGVGIRFNTSYNNTLVSTAYKIADLNFSYSDNAAGSMMDLSLFSPAGVQQKMLTADAAFFKISIGTLAAASGNIYDYTDTGTISAGALAGAVDRVNSTGAAPTFTNSPAYGIFVGATAGGITTSRTTAPSISYGSYTTAVGVGAGVVSLSDVGSAGALTITTGYYNTYLGLNAGTISLDTAGTFVRGSYNIGIGAHAGSASLFNIGDANIAIGYNSLNSQFGSIGNYNVAIGNNAGFTSVGDSNTLIGANAGSSLIGNAMGVTIVGTNTGGTVNDYDVAISNGGASPDLALYATGSAGGTGFTNVYLGSDGVLAPNIRNTSGLKFFDSEFRIVDNTDNTKVANFECSGISTATTRTLTVPNASGTIALLSLAQTFSAAQTFSSTFTVSGTTTNISLNAGQTTGTIVVGGTAGTGAITVGQSTAAQTLNLATGATANATTKTVNIGTAGVSGSTTNINIGSAVSGATSTVTVNGTLKFNSGYGSAADAYGCRAWVNFNGTGTVAIRADGNVTSITDGGTGIYTVNLTTAMPDVNYATKVTSGGNTTAVNACVRGDSTAPTTSAVQIATFTSAGANADSAFVYVAIFR